MLVTTFWLAPFLFSSSGDAVAGDGGALAILERAALEDEAEVAGAAARLARLGARAIPEVFALLVSGQGPDRALTELETRALLEALAACRIADVREHLRGRLAAGLVTDERRALLAVLARVGSSADVPLARSATQAGGESAALASALEPAIAGLLGRDPAAMEPVRRWILQAPPELAGALVRGAAGSGCPAALPALVELLGFDWVLDRVLVPEIGGLVERAPKPIAEDVVAALVELLDGDDPIVLREAALALAKAESFEATGLLIALLEHAERGVRAGAATALEQLTGLRFQERSERWRAWHEAEAGWLRQHGAELRSRLRGASTERVVGALSEISQHRFRRHELAAEVVIVLEHEDPLARRLACLTLARLGSSAGIPGLLAALEDPEEDVRAAARSALERLGIDPPMQVDAETSSLALAGPGRG